MLAFIVITCLYFSALGAAPVYSAARLEKLRAAYPAVAPGSTPSWITAEKKIWQKYGLEVEPILVSGGARAVPALIGQSVQFLFGSDTGVTTAQLQGIPVVRLGVTMNNLGSSLVTQQSKFSESLGGATLATFGWRSFCATMASIPTKMSNFSPSAAAKAVGSLR